MKIRLLVLLLLTGCGKAPSYSEKGIPRTGRKTESLTGKSPEEILRLKYLIPPALICRVTTTRKGRVPVFNELQDSFRKEIPGETSLKYLLNYRIEGKSLLTAFQLGGELEWRDHVSVEDSSGKEYYMESTPVLAVSWKRGEREMLQNGEINSPDGYQKIFLFENLETPIFRQETRISSKKIYIEEVRCMLQTKIAAEYKSQWRWVR